MEPNSFCKRHNTPPDSEFVTYDDTWRRTYYLAQPKYRTNKYFSRIRPHMKNKKSIEIIRPPDISTRLKQLAIRPVRHLISSRNEYTKINPWLMNTYDRHIQKSIHTVYSRLANVQLKLKPESRKWNENDWRKHQEWLSKRALPKKEFQEIREMSPLKPIDMSRIEFLAKPKSITVPYESTIKKPEETNLDTTAKPKIIPKIVTSKIGDKNAETTDEPSKPVKVYKFRERTVLLAKHKEVKQPEELELQIFTYVIPKDIRIKKITSHGIPKLAEPKNPRQKYKKMDNVPETIEPVKNLKKRKAGEPTNPPLNERLDKCKADLSESPKKNPFSVARKALRKVDKKLLKSLKKLATPKNRPKV